MPFFSMVRRPRVETRRLTQRRSPSSQKRWVCRFGRKRRRFLLLAWETRLPTATLLPVTSQTRLIKFSENQCVNDQTAGLRPSKGPPLYQPPSTRATTACDSRVIAVEVVVLRALAQPGPGILCRSAVIHLLCARPPVLPVASRLASRNS